MKHIAPFWLRAQGSVSDDVLKTEGSLVFNALSVLAYELEKIYIQMDFTVNRLMQAQQIMSI